MKISSLFLPFLTLSILAISLFSEAAASPDPVLDTSGKLLRADSVYYILPVSHRSGGGIDLTNTKNMTCGPLDVVQMGDDNPGIPVSFFPVNLKKGVVRVFTDLNIMSTNTFTVCPESTIWKLDHYRPYDPLNRKYFITTGGVIGNPGPETLGNWFKIQKFGGGYKLLHCPSVCTYCDVVCKDVGIYVQNGHRRLALTNVPFKVVFKKA